MNNEEKILAILEQMQIEQQKTNDRLAKLEAGQAKLEAGQIQLRADVEVLKEDVSVIKEDVKITRSATNTLLDWAEEAQIEVKIPLYKRAQ